MCSWLRYFLAMSSLKRLTISAVTFLAERLATMPDIRCPSNNDVSQSGTWLSLSNETAIIAANFCWLVKDLDVKPGAVRATTNSSIISLNHLDSLTATFSWLPNFSHPKITDRQALQFPATLLSSLNNKPSVTAIMDFKYFVEHLNSASIHDLWSEIRLSNSNRHCEAISLIEGEPKCMRRHKSWHGMPRTEKDWTSSECWRKSCQSILASRMVCKLKTKNTISASRICKLKTQATISAYGVLWKLESENADHS